MLVGGMATSVVALGSCAGASTARTGRAPLSARTRSGRPNVASPTPTPRLLEPVAMSASKAIVDVSASRVRAFEYGVIFFVGDAWRFGEEAQCPFA